MKKIILLVTVLLIVFLSYCKEPGTEPDPPIPLEKKAALTVEDHSLSELWLKLATENFSGTKNVLITRDEETAFEFTLSGNDTTIYNDSLKPSTNYNFSARIIDAEDDTITTKTITARTMDTTSHNFTYQMWEFGEHSSSILYDVAIIDENNIWAVGEIYLMDSTGSPDPHRYNAMHWDGTEWKQIRIPYVIGSTSYYNPMFTVFNLGADFVIFCGNGIVSWDGIEYRPIPIDTELWGPNYILSVWVNNRNSIYIGGNNGSLAHYNGTEWTKIETGTELTLTDIYGTEDGAIYAAGVDMQQVKGIVLRKTGETIWETMITSEIIDESELFDKLYGSISSVWLDEKNTLYTAGSFLFRYENNEWDYVKSLNGNCLGCNPLNYRGYLYSIRGNGSNDYIIAGDRNTLKHFNGSTWRQLGLPYDQSSNIIWVKVTQQNNIVVAVGDIGSKAAIILLER
ncbi:MAG: hypothetical protein K9J16_04620 [Melioribacteraceae bacterium]|nr:hypothetical protein [Melioribacteraceae bacterium]MCF8355411.1 hypothetical protein [Melioribacteraceae bacterium]MCF8393253.1 hypothetical protein [Melioribacteraceae bacterium]MCF8417554.1 hypothetical protein [Melioribacteraceae bacterium]